MNTDNAGRRSKRAERPGTRPRRGRILRVKEGYNPNSSSMGSIVFSLPVMLLGTAALFGTAAGILFSALMRSGGGDVGGAGTPGSEPTEGHEEGDEGPEEASP